MVAGHKLCVYMMLNMQCAACAVCAARAVHAARAAHAALAVYPARGV